MTTVEKVMYDQHGQEKLRTGEEKDKDIKRANLENHFIRRPLIFSELRKFLVLLISDVL